MSKKVIQMYGHDNNKVSVFEIYQRDKEQSLDYFFETYEEAKADMEFQNRVNEIAVRKNTNNYELIYLQIDKKDCSSNLNALAVNEGYDSEHEYLSNIYNSAEEFPRVNLHILRGKILHWTDYKY